MSEKRGETAKNKRKKTGRYQKIMKKGFKNDRGKYLWKDYLFFAIPLFLGNLFQQLYNTADSLIVGNFLGSNALAAHRKPETYRANLCG